jgi:hypothetical protein
MARITHDEVVEIVGHHVLEDEQIVDIIETGADARQLTIAFERSVRGQSVAMDQTDPDAVVIHRLCQILNEVDLGPEPNGDQGAGSAT